jgi:hypothetical protein
MARNSSARSSQRQYVYAVTKILRGMDYLRRAGGITGGYSDEALEQIAHIARAEKVKAILVESNFGDGMFVKLLEPVLRRIYPCAVEEVRSMGQEERRIIDMLEPVLNQHRLIVDAALLRADQKSDPKYQLFHQLTRITRERGRTPDVGRVSAASRNRFRRLRQIIRELVVRQNDR